MYTYKRYFRFHPINRCIQRIIFKAKDRSFYIRAALYICIAGMLALSFIFVNGAAVWAAYKKQIAFQAEGQPADASGYDTAFQDSLIAPEVILAQEMPVIYGVDIRNVIENSDTDKDIYFDVLHEDIKLEILRFTNEPKEFYVSAKGPQILIYHTHTTEAYRQVYGQEYVEAGAWRTKDERKSVVAVGNALEKELKRYGYTVLHDKTDHEPPALKTAYSRSLDTMEDYDRKYPELSVYIDVHRDASSDKDDFVTINGEECARIMFVVGTGENYNVKPNYESNYKLALAVTNELESIKKGFTRPIRVKVGRYNQHVSDMCILIEVGHNANTLEQALNSVKYIALALSRVLEISGP